ncbi:glycine dehydrogenase (decarboxylating), partial [Striga asiatica]
MLPKHTYTTEPGFFESSHARQSFSSMSDFSPLHDFPLSPSSLHSRSSGPTCHKLLTTTSKLSLSVSLILSLILENKLFSSSDGTWLRTNVSSWGRPGRTKVSESEDRLLCGSWPRMCSEAQRAKQPQHWKMSRGMPSVLVGPTVQGRNTPETRQLALRSRRRHSSGSRRRAVASKNLAKSSGLKTWSRLKMFFGRREFSGGKSRVLRPMSWPEERAGSTVGAKGGVMMMVALSPREVKSLAKSRVGIILPYDMAGKRTICSCAILL